MSTFDAVLFDFSDTLFWRDGAARLIGIAQNHGVDLRDDPRPAVLWDEIKARSMSVQELAHRRDSSVEAHRTSWLRMFRPFDELAPSLQPSLSVQLYDDQADPTGWMPYPDTVDVLNTLAERGVPIGVVTDIGWNIEPILTLHGTRKSVGTIVHSFEEGTEKPDPTMFLSACARLGCNPTRTLMIGDSVSKDGGAAASGLTAIVLPAWSGQGDRGLRSVLRLVEGTSTHQNKETS